MVSFAVSRSGTSVERCTVACQNFLTPVDNPGARTDAGGRRARPSDLAALVELDRACFGRRAWSARAWREAVTAPEWLTTVIERDGAIVAASVLIPEVPRASLASIAVAPDWRRRGLGRALLRQAVGPRTRGIGTMARARGGQREPRRGRVVPTGGFRRLAAFLGRRLLAAGDAPPPRRCAWGVSLDSWSPAPAVRASRRRSPSRPPSTPTSARSTSSSPTGPGSSSPRSWARNARPRTASPTVWR